MPKVELKKAWAFKGRTLEPGRKITITNKLYSQMKAEGYFDDFKQIVVPLHEEE